MKFTIAVVGSDAERFDLYENELRCRLDIVSKKVATDVNLKGGRMLHVVFDANAMEDTIRAAVKDVERICSIGINTARIGVVFPGENHWKKSWSN